VFSDDATLDSNLRTKGLAITDGQAPNLLEPVEHAGGNQITASFAGMKYSVKADCSIQVSYSMKFNELGGTVGPFQRLMLPVFKADSLEVYVMELGTPPGTPVGSSIDTGVAHRISMQI